VVVNVGDVPALTARYKSAQPFPFILMEHFVDDDVAREVAAAYPTFEEAGRLGFAFNAVNERKKIQISDRTLFPEPVERLHQALSSPEFLATLSTISGIPNLMADHHLFGAGMHITGPHGRLDVHVDFNMLEIDNRRLYRRLNLLLYLNPACNEAWGGEIELWNREVTTCAQSYAPVMGRCLLFETSGVSFHGVAPHKCPPNEVRRSFAAYYTLEAPANCEGLDHSTIFKGRPGEKFRAKVLMPAERLQRQANAGLRTVYWKTRGLVRRMMFWR
jgi:hypothetical protein